MSFPVCHEQAELVGVHEYGMRAARRLPAPGIPIGGAEEKCGAFERNDIQTDEIALSRIGASLIGGAETEPRSCVGFAFHDRVSAYD